MSDAFLRPGVKQKGQDKPTLLEVVLRVQGDFRSRLASIDVTPLQAGVMLYLQRHVEAKLKDVASALGVQSPTMAGVIQDLVRDRWVTMQRALHDDRTLSLQLTKRGQVLARKIMDKIVAKQK